MTDYLRAHFAHPENCPYCGHVDVEGGSLDIESKLARQRVRCLGCSRQWWDVYRLAAIVDDQGQEQSRAQPGASSDPAVAEQRTMRQRDIVPPERLATCRATVIGVGAIGRQVALQLAAMGVAWLQLIDHDVVEFVNLGPQGFLEDDVGRPKVEAVADLCQQIGHQLEVHELSERFRRSQEIGNVLFCSVDSIATRRLVWEAVKDRAQFFADGRMSAEVIRVLAAADAASRTHYPTTLFGGNEAYSGACTARSTIFTASIAAGLMLHQFTRWLRHLPVDADLTLNLLASELTVAAAQGCNHA